MLYRTLGKTNLSVSVLGLGCSGLGGVFGDVTEAEAIRTVHTALEEGINYLDTSPLYGFTKSETVVGKALNGVSRDHYFLSSKVGRYTFNDSDFSYERVSRGLDESLERLGCGYLDIAILHDIEYVPLYEVIDGGLRALLDARADGRIRFIGASGMPLKIFPAILGRTELDAIISYANYTLTNTSLETILPLLEERNVGVINASPLTLGLLTRKPVAKWHQAGPELIAKCREAVEWCDRRGVDIAEVGLQFALGNPRIATTLSGACSPQEVKQNVRCVGKSPDPQILAGIRAITEPVRDIAWPCGREEYN
ncbi:MAG: aldo/keto reductase [Acidobacteria bacterium]|nr:aldo/keto reductase [Acidobacteriota bacterium]